MKVRCIDTEGSGGRLSLQVYTVQKILELGYYILANDPYEIAWFKHRFVIEEN